MNSPLTTPDFVEILGRFVASPGAEAIAATEKTASGLINRLHKEMMSVEAVQMLSRILPGEQAVEWAKQSAEFSGRSIPLSKEEEAALGAAGDWIAAPGEETRLASLDSAKELPVTSPSYWTANAAGFSETAAALPEEAVAPDLLDDLTAHFAAGAVMLAAARGLSDAPAAGPETDRKDMEAPGSEEIIPPELPDDLKLPGDSADMEKIDLPGIPEIPEMTGAEREKAAKLLDPYLKKGLEIAKKKVPGWS